VLDIYGLEYVDDLVVQIHYTYMAPSTPG
jgi:hypothetical protein